MTHYLTRLQNGKLSALRKQKREWLKNTFSKSYLKDTLKLKDGEISQIKSEVRYGHERYNPNDVKVYLDLRISKEFLTLPPGNTGRIKCKHCKKPVNKDYFSNSKTRICLKCERMLELKNKKELERVNNSKLKKPHRDQMQLL